MKVLKYIEENPNTYLRDISRSLGINPATVHRILKSINEFLEFTSINERIEANLPNMPVFVKLKDGITPEGILRYVITKNEIEV